MGVRFSSTASCSMSRGSLKFEQGITINEKGCRCVRLNEPAFLFSPSRACHCEESGRATWQSTRKTGGDCLAEFSLSEAEWARNDRSLANVILRHVVPKILVRCKKNPPVQRTRCFTSFSMTSSCILSFLRRCAAHSQRQLWE